jgi:hypothetical protein
MNALTSKIGTKRTNRAGLMMSVVRGRPEVTRRSSNRCDLAEALIRQHHFVAANPVSALSKL